MTCIASNLIGAVLKKKCVCAGYAELLRNLCACRGIECICVGAEMHVFNQVKIGGKWYYFDMTSLKGAIKRNCKIENFLQSIESFQANGKPQHIPLEGQTIYESSEDFIDNIKCNGNISGFIRKVLQSISKKEIIAAEKKLDTAEVTKDRKNKKDK